MIDGEDLLEATERVAYRQGHGKSWFVLLEIDGTLGAIEFGDSVMHRALDGNGNPIEYRVEREFMVRCSLTEFQTEKIAGKWAKETSKGLVLGDAR